MNKAPILLLLILLSALSFGTVYSYASDNKDVNQLKLNQAIRIDDQSRLFQTSGEGKNKTQFRIKNNHNNENSEFMIKGVISAFSVNSITIGENEIKIDSSITEDIKIVGTPTVNAYAMIKGIIVGSDKYAEKIIVNQRNKNNIVEEEKKDDNEHLSPTPTVNPSITPSQTQSSNATESNKTNLSSDLGNIIVRVQDFLNYLKDIASKI